jgi:murein DD-endopeptidase MepM/ murein hydrolase activator NlpD
MLQSLPVAKVIGREGLFAEIDLSVDNNGLPNTENAGGFEDFIDSYLYKHNAVVAFGGYNEQRNLYKRSEIFNGNSEERNIHIGMDLWTKAGTPVLAALDGKIHSFDYNAGIGNYGPTIILEHQINQQQFYTLYGHLSLESISDIGIGETYGAGQQLATLGDASVNGDYAPHLHFQIIKDIQDNFGDYPGVCSKTDLTFYLENCPDPNLLLKLNKTK